MARPPARSRRSWTGSWGDHLAHRVAFLRSKSVGGVEPRLAKEARALARNGYDVHVILWDRDLVYPATEAGPGYTVHRVRYRAPYNRASLAWKLPRWWLKAFGLLKELRPDVVHAADLDTVPPALWACRSWDARVVFDIWDFYGDMITAQVPDFIRRALARWEARAVRRADLVVLFDIIGKTRLGVEPRRLIEVRNVPEHVVLAPEEHARFVVFYGGNLSKDRGLSDLVRACEATGASLIVAGQGPDESELAPLVETSPNGLFLGQVSHEEILKQTVSADVIPVLYDPRIPINRFASPNKIYEAMMFSKPVIVSEGIGVAELVRDGGFGLVVPYGDLPALRSALEALMLSPATCAEMGLRARRIYEERFRWEVMEARLLAGYREILPGGAASLRDPERGQPDADS